MRLTEQKLKELILEVMENDDDSIGMKHLSAAIKQLNNPDESIRENTYESFISLWEMIFDDPHTKSVHLKNFVKFPILSGPNKYPLYYRTSTKINVKKKPRLISAVSWKKLFMVL